MSYFNYIESLFLISLGITFVLILFLIYHFKQRITSLEQKTETLFGIVNSIVKDMRTFVQSSFRQVPPIPNTNISLQQEKVTTNKMEEHEDEEGDEEEEEEEDEDEEEDDEEDNNFKILVIKEDNDIILNGIEEVIAPETQQRDITPNEVFEEINVQVSSAETSVEVTSAEVHSAETSVEVTSEEVHSAETSVEVTSEEVPQLKVTSVEVPSVEVPSAEVHSAETSVEVTSEEVLQLKVTREESTEETTTKEEKPTDEKLNYHKLHISELKKLVSTKKLTTQDISKLKKPELIKILEDSEN